MKRLTARSVILVFAGLLLFADSTASAQSPRRRSTGRRYPSVTSEPLVSPYLNLALPTGDPGFNYLTLVQPQLQQQRYNQQQTAQTQLFNRELQQQGAMISPYGPIGGIRPTGGRAATFGNYSHYYPSKGQGPSGGRPRQYRTGLGTAGGGGLGGGFGGFGMGGFGGGF